VIALLAVAHAGAWTKERGQAYVKLGADVYDAVTFQPPGATEPMPGAYIGQQGGFYGEAGLLEDGWRAQAAVSWGVVSGHHRAEVSDVVGDSVVRASTTRPGDLRLTGQVALHRTAPLALSVEVKIPTYANEGVGAYLQSLAFLFPKPGDGQIDVTPQVHAGVVPFEKGFAEVSAGYRFRTEAFVGWDTTIRFADGVLGAGKLGVDLGRVLPIVGAEALVAVRDDLYTRQYAVVYGTALVDLVPDHLALEPRASAELWAKNASRGYGVGLGLSYRR
jgi:hypothetical protein